MVILYGAGEEIFIFIKQINNTLCVCVFFVFFYPQLIHLITGNLEEDCSLYAVSVTSGAESWTICCMFWFYQVSEFSAHRDPFT